MDAIFVEAPPDVESLERVARGRGGRPGREHDRGREDAAAHRRAARLGYDLIVTPLTALFAATKAVQEVLAVLKREGTVRDHPEMMVSFTEFEPVVDLDGHKALEDRYR